MATGLRRAFESPILYALVGAAIIAASITVSSVTIGGEGGPSFTSGSGAPTSTAPLGSLYLRTDEALLYQNTNGGSAWSALTLSGVDDDTAWFGTGQDGECNFDGVSDVAGFSPSLVGAGAAPEIDFGGYQAYQPTRSLFCTNITIATNVIVALNDTNVGGLYAQGTLTINGTGIIEVAPDAGGNAAGGIGGAAGTARTHQYYAGRGAGAAGGSQAGGCGVATSKTNLPYALTTCAANAPGTPACRGQGGWGGKNETGTGANGPAIATSSITSGNWGYFELPNILSYKNNITGTGSLFSSMAGGSGGCGSSVAGDGGAGGGGSSGYQFYVFARRIVDNGTGGAVSLATNDSGSKACEHALCARGGNGGDAQQTGCATHCKGGGGGGGAGGIITVITSGPCPQADVRGGVGGQRALDDGATTDGGDGGEGLYTCRRVGV